MSTTMWALGKMEEVVSFLPPRLAIVLLAVGVIGGFAYQDHAIEARLSPLESAVSEQTQILRYLGCVDRRGGPTPEARSQCAHDHLSDSLLGILGGP